jgi:hypothetical protein
MDPDPGGPKTCGSGGSGSGFGSGTLLTSLRILSKFKIKIVNLRRSIEV